MLNYITQIYLQTIYATLLHKLFHKYYGSSQCLLIGNIKILKINIFKCQAVLPESLYSSLKVKEAKWLKVKFLKPNCMRLNHGHQLLAKRSLQVT